MVESIAENGGLYGFVQISKADYRDALNAVFEGIDKCPDGFDPGIDIYEFRSGFFIFLVEHELY